MPGSRNSISNAKGAPGARIEFSLPGMSGALYRQLAIAALFVILTVVLTFPAILQVSGDVIGSGGDPWQAMWRFEDKWQQLTRAQESGTLVDFLQYEFLGGGEARLINLSVWPWMWLHLMFGQPVAYNLIYFLSFAIAGLAMYHLVRFILQSASEPLTTRQREAASVVAGIAYMFLPFHVAHSQGHFGAMQTQWLPLVAIASILFVRRPSLLRAVVLILLLVIQAWSEHHYLLWLLLLAVIASLYYQRSILAQLRPVYLRTLATATVAALLIGVSYAPTIRQAVQAASTLTPGVDQTVRFSADLFAFFLPAPFHPWWGNFFYTIYGQNFTGNVTEATQFLGLIPLLLVIFFYRQVPLRPKFFWALTAIFFGILSLGPWLHVLGHVTPIPLPYYLLQHLPVFSAIRAVARAGAMVGLSMSVLLGLVLATQVRRPLSFLLVAVAILVEFLFYPIPTQSARLHPVYQEVATLAGSTLLEIPAATNYLVASQALYASRHHGKAVIDNIALERGSTTESIGKLLPGVRQLLYVRTTDLREHRQEFFGQDVSETFPEVVQAHEIAAIIVHTDSLSAFQTTMIRNFLEKDLGLVPQPFEDALLYPLQRLTLCGDGVFALRGDGWENVGLDKKRAATFAEIPRRAQLRLTNVTSSPLQVRLRFTLPPETHTGLSVTYNDAAVTVEPDQNTSSDRDRHVTITIPPGESRLDFINGLPDKAIIQNPRLEVVTAN